MDVYKSQNDVPRLALNSAEAAKALGVSKRTLFDMVKRGDLPCVRWERKYLFTIADIEAWLQSRSSTQQKE